MNIQWGNTLHVNDGIAQIGNTTQIDKLREFFQKFRKM